MKDIKLYIFDVDGVLVDSKSVHYPATRNALLDYGYMYSEEEDENFGTIPTREKLNKLVEQKKINYSDLDSIWKLKDKYTCELFDEFIKFNLNIKDFFAEIKNRGSYIALVSNARYNFLYKVMDGLDVNPYIDSIRSAQNCKPKPSPDMYLDIMKFFDVSPENTIIFEDSRVGIQAAYSSGANVYEVSSYDELSCSFFNKP